MKCKRAEASILQPFIAINLSYQVSCVLFFRDD